MFKFKYQDHYFKQAKKEWYKARSAYKLEEIQEKFHLFDKNTKTILDIGCAPGSRIQYAAAQAKKHNIRDYKIIGVDIKDMQLNMPWVLTYKADITDKEHINHILEENGIQQVDLIQSDMAPNTTWAKDVDAIRLFELLEYVKPILKNHLKPEGKFVLKLFMGPWFEEFVKEMKQTFWAKHIKMLKPQASRKESKETYIIKTE